MLNRIKEPSSWIGAGGIGMGLDLLMSPVVGDVGRTVADAAMMGAKGNWIGATALIIGGLLSIFLPEGRR